MSDSAASPFVLRWGILGAGWIASEMVKDLTLDPSTRQCTDVVHSIAAVASRDVDKAQKWIDEYCPRGAWAQIEGLDRETKVTPVGSYEELYQREDVDLVYVATPHVFHFEQAKAALEAGKNVLIEKPAVLNQKEWDTLVEIAKEKKVFLMEAVWTRFFPVTYKFQELVHEKKVIGDIRQLWVDFGMDFYSILDDSHRVFNPNLAGGAMLDLGPYALVWMMMTLFQHPDNNGAEPSKMVGSMLPHPRTGVDLYSSITLDFDNLLARAHLTVNNAITTQKDVGVRVMGTKGSIILPAGPNRPEKLTIRLNKPVDPPMLPCDYEEEVLEYPINGFGLHFEADACARSIRDGEKENPRMPWEETSLTMKIFDTWREQSGYKYPADLEKM
ncbi:hypothetical protein JCM11251_005223 [Rhodosporidiobolus azoricus]